MMLRTPFTSLGAQCLPSCSASLRARPARVLAPAISCEDNGRRRGNEGRARDGDWGRSKKGKSYENKRRRKGRPAWQRSPYDTPLRDGNRDRLIGLLTERCGAGSRARGARAARSAGL